MKDKRQVEIINRKVKYDYYIEDTLECGISLLGTEIKSIRLGKANIKEAWCNVVNNELYVNGMHISQFEQGNIWNHEELRTRKLLAKKSEIKSLEKYTKESGYTLVPLKLYINDRGKAKLSVGVCKGKHNYDKRQAIKERDVAREVRRNT